MECNDSAAFAQEASERLDAEVPVSGRSIVSLSPTYHRWLLKRWFERSLATAGLVVASPLLLLLIVLVRRSSPGAAIYSQDRVGLCGRAFRMYKLRSMVKNAEEWTGAVWAMEDDPRVTPIGRILRKYHLDELPQLWNIACGQMSFVGPRPERPQISEGLSEEIPGYQHRLTVLPGVTGLAQVNLSPDQTVDCVRRKIELDLEYIFTAEPILDLRILGCTSLKMLGVPRDTAAKLLGVTRKPSVTKPSLPATPPVATSPATTLPATMAPADNHGSSIEFYGTLSERPADAMPVDVA